MNEVVKIYLTIVMYIFAIAGTIFEGGKIAREINSLKGR